MATDRASALASINRFLDGHDRYCLIEGTHQLGKLSLAFEALLRRHPGGAGLLRSLLAEPVLFRAVTFQAGAERLSAALPGQVSRGQIQRDRKAAVGGMTIHLDTFDQRTWAVAPDRLVYAFVYPPERLTPSKVAECMLDLTDREAGKVFFCTLADAAVRDLGWIHELNPHRVTYHIKAEKPDAHVDTLQWSKPESYFVENA